MSAKKILVIEDEQAIREMIGFALRREGHECLDASSTREAEVWLENQIPDVMLVDWMLPGMSGVDFIRHIKQDKRLQDVPVIMLTARSEEDDKITGLDAGADDYICKPFSPRELVARLKAVLRRATPRGVEDPIEINGLLLDPVSHRVSAHGKALEMGPTEYRLLQFFMTHQERAYTRSQLLDQVWGGNVYVEERTVDVHIRRLRKALGEAHQNLIQTVRGTGYRFSARV